MMQGVKTWREPDIHCYTGVLRMQTQDAINPQEGRQGSQMLTTNRLNKKWLAVGLSGIVAAAMVACGTDNAPASGPTDSDGDVIPTPPPSGSAQSGYDAVRRSLEIAGATVLSGEQESSGLFDSPYTQLIINGETVDVYEFTNMDAAAASASAVSPDGTIVSPEDGAPPLLHKIGKEGSMFALYRGQFTSF